VIIKGGGMIQWREEVLKGPFQETAVNTEKKENFGVE